MGKLSCEVCVKWLCGILFSVFAFCWIYFFQQDLLCAAYNKALYGMEHPIGVDAPNSAVVALLLTAFSQLLVLPGKFLLRFKRGLYACNYLFAAVFLGIITIYDGNSLFGELTIKWMVTVIFAVLLYLVCKIVASVPRSDHNDRPRTLAGNLLILAFLFCMTGYVGNTDENLHRRLRMERLYAEQDYEGVLNVGSLEEESNPAIDLLRAKSMLNLPADANPAGSRIGDLLFEYSISDPKALSAALKEMDNTQAYLTSCLLQADLASFRDSLHINDYTTLPKYYLQALIIANDTTAQAQFPDQYAKEYSEYTTFQASLAQVESEPQQYQSNATYIPHHQTYFWFYTFHK